MLWVGIFIFIVAQIMVWFQSNSGLLGEPWSNNYVALAIFMGPIISIMFAFGTKVLYNEMESLWSVRFITFGIGYMTFIPLTWYFFGEEIFTFKNMISISLCILLISLQFIME